MPNVKSILYDTASTTSKSLDYNGSNTGTLLQAVYKMHATPSRQCCKCYEKTTCTIYSTT